jgi:hypothetical protein
MPAALLLVSILAKSIAPKRVIPAGKPIVQVLAVDEKKNLC